MRNINKTDARRATVTRFIAASTLALAGLSGCMSTIDEPLSPALVQATQAGAALPEAHAPQGLGFSVLHTAHSKGAQEALIVSGGSWLRRRTPEQVAILVKHPKGTFMFDAGLGRKVDEQFAVNTWLDKQFFGYADVNPAADQLARAGWKPEDIGMIIPSHMHWDHVSALPDFPQAQVWVTSQEREHAEFGHAPGFLQSQFSQVSNWHELRFTHGAYLGFDRSLDLFGDGAVVLVPLSGHTAGQVGMFLNLPSGQRYFFTGDVTWTIEGLRTRADRSWLLRQILHVDQDEAANQACIVHINRLMQRFPQLTVVPAHDENVLKGLPRFPAFQG
jgi:glyoxylase-like metal-dependent hydrolase (beta-lactamase superfamily II)